MWNAAASVQEIADFFGLSRRLCCSRSQILRRDGIQLKRFPTRGGGRSRVRSVSDSEFARVWDAETSTREVAEILGLAPKTVHNYAHRLRRKGVALKRYKHGPHVSRRRAPATESPTACD